MIQEGDYHDAMQKKGDKHNKSQSSWPQSKPTELMQKQMNEHGLGSI